jgi:prepilin-type N-terminal cleavage/methylation domain-containing protein
MHLNTVKLGKSIHSAFTLVEIMIVMVVMAIMVAFTIPVSKYVSNRARMASQKVYIEKIKNALEDYRAAYGEYPITPATNAAGEITNHEHVQRHFPSALTVKILDVNNVLDLTTNTVETLDFATAARIDYCLTWPLMLKQRAAGARPFMDFKEVTVSYLATQSTGTREKIVTSRSKSGGFVSRTIMGIWSDPINRPKAMDPISQLQWKYYSENGLTYTLTTNGF